MVTAIRVTNNCQVPSCSVTVPCSITCYISSAQLSSVKGKEEQGQYEGSMALLFGGILCHCYLPKRNNNARS